MSKKMSDGGPAFPVYHAHFNREGTQFNGQSIIDGMSLRDYFAAKAMASLVSLPNDFDDEIEELAPQYAQAAYEYADAMLAARSALDLPH